MELNEKEQRAYDAILEAYKAMYDLVEDGEKYNFTEEVIPAIHILQHHVMQYWANRVNPNLWANWRK